MPRRASTCRPSKRRIGYVFQDALLFPHMDVEVEPALRPAAAPAADRFIDEARVVELLGLGALLQRKPKTLSGGEKQRVAIGRALLAQPRILLMDEPLAALDVPRKTEILDYVERLRDELGIPIVYVSHSVVGDHPARRYRRRPLRRQVPCRRRRRRRDGPTRSEARDRALRGAR